MTTENTGGAAFPISIVHIQVSEYRTNMIAIEHIGAGGSIVSGVIMSKSEALTLAAALYREFAEWKPIADEPEQGTWHWGKFTGGTIGANPVKYCGDGLWTERGMVAHGIVSFTPILKP